MLALIPSECVRSAEEQYTPYTLPYFYFIYYIFIISHISHEILFC